MFTSLEGIETLIGMISMIALMSAGGKYLLHFENQFPNPGEIKTGQQLVLLPCPSRRY
jgi:hypothetical protein